MKNITKAAAAFFFFAIFLASCSKKDDPLNLPDPKPDPKPPTTNLVFPKKEMRGVWIATVWGLDWPETTYAVEPQKQKYIAYLNKLKELNMNAIFFQVKGMGDAYYNSSYEPWSVSITGTRGQNPGYDVLKFMIEEAHARGIEFHAWMNPYRIATRAGISNSYPALHPSVDPSWVIDHEKIQIYNPAVPAVRTRLADIVKELITKYNVDGIHFDDYFYPEGVDPKDAADYSTYGQGYSNIQDFRRGNVDKAIEAVHNVIVATKPEVVFSVSPAPSITKNFNSLYADIKKWAKNGWMDVVIPQLYHEVGHKTSDFVANLQSWVQNDYGVPVMVGHGLYRFGDPTAGAAFQSSAELQKQFDVTKASPKILGNVQYSAKYLYLNKVGVTDKLKEIYKDKAVMPFLGRAIAPAPVAASGVKIEGNKLKWSTSGDVESVVYYFSDLKKPAVVLAVTKANDFDNLQKGFYSVATLNKDSKESKPSDVVEKK